MCGTNPEIQDYFNPEIPGLKKVVGYFFELCSYIV